MRLSTIARFGLVSLGAAATVAFGAGVATAEQTDPPVCQVTPTDSSCNQPTLPGGNDTPHSPSYDPDICDMWGLC